MKKIFGSLITVACLMLTSASFADTSMSFTLNNFIATQDLKVVFKMVKSNGSYEEKVASFDTAPVCVVTSNQPIALPVHLSIPSDIVHIFVTVQKSNGYKWPSNSDPYPVETFNRMWNNKIIPV